MKVRIGYGLGVQGFPDDKDGSAFGVFVDDLERCGFDSLWLSERITGGAVDPLIGLAVAAGRTQRMKFGTSVLVVPGRNPALLAKELASLDRLSGGRLLPAVGLGVADPREQQAFGVERKERGAWFEEALPLIRRFWTGEPVDHDGPRFHYEGMQVLPTPLQSPPDVWLGGQSAKELARIGRLGDGWLPSFIVPSEAAAGRVLVDQAASDAGRAIDPEHFGPLVIYTRGEVPERLLAAAALRRPGVDPSDIIPAGIDGLRAHIRRFVDVGFSKFVLVPAHDPGARPGGWTAELEMLAAEVLPLQKELSS